MWWASTWILKMVKCDGEPPDFTVFIWKVCHNRVPKTMPKTIESYCLTVLEVRSPRSRCLQGLFLLKAVRKDLFHVFLLLSCDLLAITGIPYLVRGSLQSLSLCSQSVLPLFLSILDEGHTLLQHDLILTNYSCNKHPCFQKRSHFEIQGIRTLTS
jgi:hypothetical protein